MARAAGARPRCAARARGAEGLLELRGLLLIHRVERLGARAVACGRLLREKDGDGRTAVHWAAAHGEWETLKFLAAKGCDLREPDNSGRTPACIAEAHVVT